MYNINGNPTQPEDTLREAHIPQQPPPLTGTQNMQKKIARLPHDNLSYVLLPVLCAGGGGGGLGVSGCFWSCGRSFWLTFDVNLLWFLGVVPMVNLCRTRPTIPNKEAM